MLSTIYSASFQCFSSSFSLFFRCILPIVSTLMSQGKVNVSEKCLFLHISSRLPFRFTASISSLNGRVMWPQPSQLQCCMMVLRKNWDFKLVNGWYKVFSLHVFNGREYRLEIQPQRVCHLVLPLFWGLQNHRRWWLQPWN